MNEHETEDALIKEYKSAGSLLMRYADHQVAKSRSPDAIERLTRRKLRAASTGQVVLVVWSAVQVLLLTNYDAIRERGWTAETDTLGWLVFATVSCVWLQRVKGRIRDAGLRLVEHLRERGAPPSG